METYIGCSGYHYSDWKKKFYPEDLPRDEWLAYYAGHFNTVEINNTFYKMPSRADLKQWYERTPDQFRFTIKANRFFTHLKKLKQDDAFSERLEDFQDILKALKNKLSCVLWQLPGNLHKNVPKLESFCNMVDHGVTHVIEFRHPSWFDDEVYEALEKGGVSFCILSAPGKLPETIRVTSRTAYVRFHGKDKWYDYHYGEKELEDWKDRLDRLKDTDTLFAYFNNDQHANAVENAGYLKLLFGK
jgi:uncharacterized protein YecE (DUF72 family)